MKASRPDERLSVQSVSLEVQGKTLLKDIHLELVPGQVAAILGPNGAGKSSLLGVLAGLTQATQGHVSLEGEYLKPETLHKLACRRAFLPQETMVAFDFTAREIVDLGRFPHRFSPSKQESVIVEAAMELTGTLHLANRRMGWLSGGERLRVQLARVFAQIWEAPPCGHHRWLLLDEPTASLDLQHQHHLLSTVRSWAKERNVGVLMVLHDLNLAMRYADWVWVLQDGMVRNAGPAQQVLNADTISNVWKVSSFAAKEYVSCPQLIFEPL